MAVTEQVIIDFIPDLSKLQTAYEQLATSGQLDKDAAAAFTRTTKAVTDQQEEIAFLKRLLDESKKAATQLGEGAKKAFEQGMADALKEAGVTMEEFLAALKKAGQGEMPKAAKATGSLKKELRELTAQIAAAKANGSPIDPAWIERAGQLKDAIADANAEISNAGSDTRNLDNVIGSVQALAGGFAIAQGAAALFGSESEDLNKALLKVNAAIALSTGIQQIANAVQKEGALTKLADTIATKGQSAAQVIYTAVTGRATAATVAFKVALATTGVGLLLVGLLALVNALTDTADIMEEVNKLIDDQNDLIENQNRFIEQNTALQIARAEAAGKAESELIRIRGRALQAQVVNLEASNRLLASQREQLSSTSEAWSVLNKQIGENNDTLRDLNNQTLITSLGLQRQLAEEAKRAAELAREARERALQSEIDIIKRRLVEVRKGGEEELGLRRQLVVAEGALEVFQAKDNAARIALVRAQVISEQEELNKTYRLRLIEEDKKARDQIILDLDQYIEEFNSKITAAAEYEQRLLDARSGKVRRSLEQVASDQNKTYDERINAVSSLEQYELTSIDKQIANVNRLLLSEEERMLRIAELEDQREQIVQATSDRVLEIRKQEALETIEIFRDAMGVFSEVNNVISSAENQRLEEQRNQLDALVEAGALTEKQEKTRRAQLEQDERAAKQRQAVRDKQIALFNAVINGAAAVIEAAPDPFRIAYTTALVGAQIAVIAARPIPRFATGKKGRYEGPGIVGEAGSELIEQNGRLWVADKRTQIYLKADDKVYTPRETKAIMQNVDTSLFSQSSGVGASIDYDRLGVAVGKNVKAASINIDKDFIRESVAQGMGWKNYFNKRYSSK
jgi:hypothetical protein